ncbi:glycoside hydrolase family 5 protein [Hysterangium stoloniferum]|nr:glycoside hydrolase family 5 protein [Hysterangium stoloniferum]
MLFPGIFLASLGVTHVFASGSLPVSKIYGVNLGSWLLLEPWMLPNEWVKMGGETCFETGGCTTCVASEFDLVKKLGQAEADKVFLQHWQTWFTEEDVRNIVDAGLNTVRIPLGYWIIESLVDRTTEFYPRGGIKELKRGLQQLKSAGINVLLDFHAMPGVSSSGQMFAGHCTTDVQFYTPPNYFRALQWAAITTFITHVDPAFSTVFAIEAVNEPLNDPTMTPGYGDYLKDFTLVIRAVELALGIICPDVNYHSLFDLAVPLASETSKRAGISSSIGASVSLSALASSCGGRVGDVLISIIPIIQNVSDELGVPNPLLSSILGSLLGGVNRQCIHTTYMDVLWQNTQGFNPADAVQGPAMFDDHLYYSFGGVADPNPQAYLKSICNLQRVTNDTTLDNLPMIFGEWSISTNFNATDGFLDQWADAQKLMYSQSSGWIFWSFKIEDNNSFQRQWDYFAALAAGHFTKDPAALHDPHVCDSFRT